MDMKLLAAALNPRQKSISPQSFGLALAEQTIYHDAVGQRQRVKRAEYSSYLIRIYLFHRKASRQADIKERV